MQGFLLCSGRRTLSWLHLVPFATFSCMKARSSSLRGEYTVVISPCKYPNSKLSRVEGKFHMGRRRSSSRPARFEVGSSPKRRRPKENLLTLSPSKTATPTCWGSESIGKRGLTSYFAIVRTGSSMQVILSSPSISHQINPAKWKRNTANATTRRCRNRDGLNHPGA